MRTLATQMRLRRIIRAHREYLDRFRAQGPSPELADAARSRLRELLGGVRSSWAEESRPGTSAGAQDLAALDRYVRRSLVALEAAAVILGSAAVEPGRQHAEFQEVALPLLFFLRGLEVGSSELAISA